MEMVGEELSSRRPEREVSLVSAETEKEENGVGVQAGSEVTWATGHSADLGFYSGCDGKPLS